MTKHYDVRIPTVMYGMDLGLPLDPEVRAFLKGFHKNEILAIADDYDRKVAAGEDPTFYPGVGPDGSAAVREDEPKPGEDPVENAVLASIGEEPDSVEIEVPVIDEGVPVPPAPVVLETRDVGEDESDNYDECDTADLLKEVRRRKLPNVTPKASREHIIKTLRRDDASKL